VRELQERYFYYVDGSYIKKVKMESTNWLDDSITLVTLDPPPYGLGKLEFEILMR